MGSGEDAQFVFAKYDYTAQGNQVTTTKQIKQKEEHGYTAQSNQIRYLRYGYPALATREQNNVHKSDVLYCKD